MKFFIILLFSPAVICAQRYRKSTNPNDEPFLPIHPEYPYNPKLMKRGIEQTQPPQASSSVQALAQLTPELYAPKVDARDSYSASYSQGPLYSTYDPYSKSSAPASALTSSGYLSSLSSYGTNPYGLLSSYGSPYAAATTPGYGAAVPNAYGPASPGAYGPAASSTYGAAASGAYGASPFGAVGGYPNYYYQPPYYYPNYYNQPPYPPPPLGYSAGPYKHKDEDEDEDEEEKRPKGKNKKSGSHKNRLRDSDRDAANNQYVDGANYIISSAKDLDSESSTHRTPTYNQIESESDIHPRTVVLPKATYRLVSVSGQQSNSDYGSTPAGYIKIQQLEQLMRQALARLLAQNAAQQANLAQIQQEAAVVQQQNNKDPGQQYIAVPQSSIAKTGLSYVINPTILNRVTPGQYSPSSLLNTQALLGGNGKQKTSTSVSLQQSPGIYIPPSKNNNDQSAPPEYADYDSQDSVTTRNQPSSISNYGPTVEPTRNYQYSTYRPTQQTSLEDVNFGNKQKNKS